MDDIIKVVEKTLRGVFQWSAFPLLFMMVLVAVDVTLRNLVNEAVPDSYEFNSMSLVVLISMALPLTTYERSHVTVTLLHQRFGHILRTVCDVISLTLGVTVFGIMSVEMVNRALYSMKSNVKLGYLRCPEYPFRFVFALGCFLTSMALLFLLIEVLRSRHKKSGETSG